VKVPVSHDFTLLQRPLFRNLQLKTLLNFCRGHYFATFSYTRVRTSPEATFSQPLVRNELKLLQRPLFRNLQLKTN